MFKNGDLVRIKDTSHMRGWRDGRDIGNTFTIRFGVEVERIKSWESGEIPSAICDQSNTYGINYYISDLELVYSTNPTYEIY